jgi:nucleotide-binding universal stress UspA family protein
VNAANDTFPIARPVVVGYNGTDQADDALRLGAQLADLLGTELVIGTVFDYFEQDPKTAAVDAYERALEAERARVVSQARSRLGDRKARMVQVLALSAAHGLHVVAAEVDAAIVVIGSTHRGSLGRVLPGSMAQRMLAAGPDPVAIAPRGYAKETGHLERIGVGFDASAESLAALPLARALAGGAHGTLVAVGAVEPLRISAPAVPTPYTGGAIESPEALEARRQRRGREIEDLLAGLPPGVEGEARVEVGEAAAILGESAGDLDLLALGSRSYGPLRRVLLGSVSARVVADAGCPVIVVPRGSVESSEDPRRRAVLETEEQAAHGPGGR